MNEEIETLKARIAALEAAPEKRLTEMAAETTVTVQDEKKPFTGEF